MPWFEFRNNYNRVVSVAVMKRDQDACGAYGGWSTHGWWNLNPGEKKTVMYSSNRYLFYFAQANNGVWWGDVNGPRMYVNPYDRFSSCYGIGTSTWNVVTTARADGGSFLGNRHTVNLNG